MCYNNNILLAKMIIYYDFYAILYWLYDIV